MNDTPILFTPDNVRAIIAGRKTQTRRIVKMTASGRVKQPGSPKNWHPDDPNAVQACPYGVPGESRLWVRETWCPRSNGALLIEKALRPFYKATDGEGDMAKPKLWPWRPSIHMPRWACRLWLELIEVRVERLQEITEEDAKAEGCDDGMIAYQATPGLRPASARVVYSRLWESINGAGSWDLNPYVWVLTFKRVTNGCGRSEASHD